MVLLGGLSLLSIREIAATKAYSIGRRGTYKDYIDLYVILKDGYTSLDAIIRMAEQKFGTNFNSRLFAEQLLFMDEDYKIQFLAAPVSQAEVLGFFADELQNL